MNQKKGTSRRHWIVLGAWLVSVPGLLGAKGCDVGDLGYDSTCGEGDGACSPGSTTDSTTTAGSTTDSSTTTGSTTTAGSTTGSSSTTGSTTTAGSTTGWGTTTDTTGDSGDTTGAGETSGGPGDSDGEECGGLTGLSCLEGEFCNYSLRAQCGAADQTGVCDPIPEACDGEYRPVCGCDGKTYSNSCSANAAGQSVMELEACADTQGCTSDDECGDDEFCEFEMGTGCGAEGTTGTCVATPQACTFELRPVCGCDGQTYSNACAAQSAGVSVMSQTACEDAESCGGLVGDLCPEGQFCRWLPEDMCGALDQTGTCMNVPSEDDCLSFSAGPACGCDGNEYMTACHAWLEGVSVSTFGPCQ